MKIIQINCVYAIGSTGKIVEDISNYCISKGDDVFVLYGRQGKNITSNIMKVSSELEAKIHSVKSRLTGLDFSYSTIATKRALNFIKSYKPDVVHLHCLNGHFINVYKLVRFLKQEKIPTILTLHAEIMHTAGCEHAYDCMKWVEGCYGCDKIKGYLTRIYRDDSKLAYSKMKESFDGFENIAIVSVSKWLENRAKQSAIFRHCHAKFITIENGLDLQSFVPLNINPLKEKFDGKNPIILHVTPNFNHPLKGGKYVIELAKKHPEWSFIIVGYNGDITLPSNVTTVGHTKNKEELSWYYNIADVTLLTSKRETFSMVCAESLACGTPVVGFRAGGPESVFIGDFARFVDYGDVRELGEAINEMITLSPNIDATLINKKFSAKGMATRYRQLYKEIIK